MEGTLTIWIIIGRCRFEERIYLGFVVPKSTENRICLRFLSKSQLKVVFAKTLFVDCCVTSFWDFQDVLQIIVRATMTSCRLKMLTMLSLVAGRHSHSRHGFVPMSRTCLSASLSPLTLRLHAGVRSYRVGNTFDKKLPAEIFGKVADE